MLFLSNGTLEEAIQLVWLSGVRNTSTHNNIMFFCPSAAHFASPAAVLLAADSNSCSATFHTQPPSTPHLYMCIACDSSSRV